MIIKQICNEKQYYQNQFNLNTDDILYVFIKYFTIFKVISNILMTI